MSAEQTEYDRFGPWIVEISDADPVPPLFKPFLAGEERSILSLKIPREIERRNARPGMHLYDYVVSLLDEELVILARVEDEVRQETFPYRDIQYLRHGEALLNGKLRLAMTGRIYDLPFNTVSGEIMQRLVDLIRQRYVERSVSFNFDKRSIRPHGDLSFYFSHRLADEQLNHPAQRLLAAQTEQPVASSESSRWRRLLFGVLGRTLLESLHFCDGVELKILDRGQPYRRRREAVYAMDRYFVPLDRIRNVTWRPDVRNAAVTTLMLNTAAPAPIICRFLQENPSTPAYARFLADIGQDELGEPLSPYGPNQASGTGPA